MASAICIQRSGIVLYLSSFATPIVIAIKDNEGVLGDSLDNDTIAQLFDVYIDTVLAVIGAYGPPLIIEADRLESKKVGSYIVFVTS